MTAVVHDNIINEKNSCSGILVLSAGMDFHENRYTEHIFGYPGHVYWPTPDYISDR